MDKLATQGTQDDEKQNKNKNTICVGHHYMQTNTETNHTRKYDNRQQSGLNSITAVVPQNILHINCLGLQRLYQADKNHWSGI